MTLLQMSYILEVDRCGSMNRAAQNLFLSQSALSAAIAEVERELGVTVFLRTNRGVTLTEEGRELVAQIAPLVEGSRQLTRYYSQRRAEDRVTLSVASQRYPFCAMAFVEYLHLLEEPHIQVSFKEMEMAADRADCDTNRLRAARFIEPHRSTSSIYVICSSVMAFRLLLCRLYQTAGDL